MGPHLGSAGAFLVAAVFEHISIDNSDRTGTRQLDDAAMFEVGKRATHGFDRYCEIVSNIVARDRECNAVLLTVG